MRVLISAIKNYLFTIDKRVLIQSTLMVVLLITLNFTVGIEPRLSGMDNFLLRLSGFFLLYAFTMVFVIWTGFLYNKQKIPVGKTFYLIIGLSALLFAAKISWHGVDLSFIKFQLPAWRKYWEIVLEWPLKCSLFVTTILILWKLFKLDKPLAGLNSKNISVKPYFILLVMMVPLIVFAATQQDFTSVYPKMKKIAFIDQFADNDWLWKLIFQLSYGTDFLSIEIFFRGFVVLALVKWLGKEAILPMAAFYCTIHFGKPLLECISSYLGGIILGVVVYETRSIWGGLIVHLGIAWLMELAGWIANR